MKPANIYSLIQAKSSLNEDGFNLYLKYHGIDIKKSEIEDLKVLADTIRDAGCRMVDFDNFYIGYKIPQIGKEFDLLRFGRSSIINIELKSICDLGKIQTQLLRNRYYLNFIGRRVYAFTFVSSSRELYFLSDSGQIEKVNPSNLLEIITKYALDGEDKPDSLFNPSDYLVSPFNSTENFLAEKYFLTQQQEDFKNQILESFKSAPKPNFISITGSAGTGKTLLTFDIARYLYSIGKKVLVIHCGQLNEGHHALIKHGWTICSIKNHKLHDLALFDVTILDEAQRIYQNQLDDIVARATLAKCECVFSYDKTQTLSSQEAKNDAGGKIDVIASITRYKLSEKIRTNKEIASFIKMLFNNRKIIHVQKSENIKINYFSNTEDAKAYLNELNEAKWEVLRFTPSQYNNEHHEKYFGDWSKTSHQVIGQEFDSVAIAVDKFFTYDDDGDLIYRSAVYYSPAKMLFQNITRARKQLNLIIIENQEILNRCLSILN